MRHALLGRTGVKVSCLSLGTMSFGGDADEATAGALFARAREAGVDFIDTADVYNGGRSEEILGRLLRGCRDEIVLASKAYFPTGRGPNDRGTSRYHLVRAVEASLRRLGTDRIDVYYLHRFDDLTDIGDSLRTLDDLVRQGKILYPACSNFAAWQVAHALGVGSARCLTPIVALQPMYNLLKRQAEVEILPMAQSLGGAVVPYSPTAGGLLTGKYRGGVRPDGSRMAVNAMYQTRYGDDAYWSAADAFTGLAAELGHAPSTLAVAWAASHPGVTSVILGARSVEQLGETLQAADLVLPPEVRARIAALTPEPPPATDRNEERTATNYGRR
jgi:aryl-alcohol dehydrogenase-like predicted oxidoreductase